MRILGLESAAQVVLLQGASTYAALASAYFFARPVLRGQTVQSSRELLTDLVSSDADVTSLIDEANEVLSRRSQQDRPKARRDNRWGLVCLVLSFLLLTGAILLQAETDPTLRSSSGVGRS